MKDLVEMMQPPRETECPDIDGHVLPDGAFERFTWRHGRMAVELQIAQNVDARWMWATCCTWNSGYWGYQVGPKWGLYCATKSGAIYWAVQEVLDRASERQGLRGHTRLLAMFREWGELLSAKS